MSHKTNLKRLLNTFNRLANYYDPYSNGIWDNEINWSHNFLEELINESINNSRVADQIPESSNRIS